MAAGLQGERRMKTSMFRNAASMLALALLAVATSASAAVVTYSSRAAFDAAFPGSVYEDWDGFANGTTFANGTGANGITYSSNTGLSVVTSAFLNSSNPNGLGGAATFFGAGDTVTFTFDFGLSAFGLDINTFAGATGDYTATTNLGDVISSF